MTINIEEMYECRVLLVGASGQVGWELQRTKPSSIGLLPLGHNDLDITNINDIISYVEYFKPDYIINAAAYTNVDGAETNADKAFAINQDGAANCAIVSRQLGIQLLHISTDFVFNGTQSYPYLTDSEVSPISVYGASKASAERRILDILDSNALILRTSWVYSAHGNNFVKTMLRLMKDGSSLNVIGDQIGSPTWANGLANAIWSAIRLQDFRGIQHWSDSGIASWYDFAVAIQEEAIKLELLDKEIPIKMIRTCDYSSRAKRPKYSVLDKTNSYNKLWEAKHWRVALRAMLFDLLNNMT